jgi:hypothetical protein
MHLDQLLAGAKKRAILAIGRGNQLEGAAHAVVRARVADGAWRRVRRGASTSEASRCQRRTNGTAVALARRSLSRGCGCHDSACHAPQGSPERERGGGHPQGEAGRPPRSKPTPPGRSEAPRRQTDESLSEGAAGSAPGVPRGPSSRGRCLDRPSRRRAVAIGAPPPHSPGSSSDVHDRIVGRVRKAANIPAARRRQAGCSREWR